MSQEGINTGVPEKKPEADASAHINLKVMNQDGDETFFRIKRSTQLKKLMTAYCERQSLDSNAITFLFDGCRLRVDQTPEQLKMEDGDEIDAMLPQTGGRDCRLVYGFGLYVWELAWQKTSLGCKNTRLCNQALSD